MKLNHIAFGFFMSLAAAQEHSSKYTAVQACIVGCPAVDICCISACEGILCPAGLYADRAAHCVSGCPLGTGTADDAAEYTRCREDCIYNNQPPDVTSSSTTSTPSSTRASTSSSPTSTTQHSTPSSIPGTSSSASTPSSSHGFTETATHSHASPSMTSNAASVSAQANMGGTLVGLLGAVLAAI